MKYLKSYFKLFELHLSKELVEDCFLEITDLYGFYLEEYNSGVIKFVGEIVGESLSCTVDGSYIDGKLMYEIKKYIKGNQNDWIIIEDDTSEGLYPTLKRLSRDRGYQVAKNILSNTPSVLSKLTRFAIGKKDIQFTINIYGVQRGTCIVFYIEYK